MRTLLLSILVTLGAAPAFAVECPPDQIGEAIEATPRESSGVAEDALGGVDLAAYGQAGGSLRMRKLTIAPGGTIGWHDHRARPAVTYILRGELTEYRAGCRVGLVHRAGDVVIEDAQRAHGWRNLSRWRRVEAIVVDLPPPAN